MLAVIHRDQIINHSVIICYRHKNKFNCDNRHCYLAINKFCRLYVLQCKSDLSELTNEVMLTLLVRTTSVPKISSYKC